MVREKEFESTLEVLQVRRTAQVVCVPGGLEARDRVVRNCA